MNEFESPFLVVNPKQYLYGKKSLAFALEIDKICEDFGVAIFYTCPYTDMRMISERTKHLILCSQSMDSLVPGRGMGKILPEALADAGVKATFLNHAENPKTREEIAKCIERAKNLNMFTIVCADNIEEGKIIAALEPTIVLIEPTDLIGTGRIVDKEFVQKAVSEIHQISEHVKVMIASGVTTPEDCNQMIVFGADGTGATSGILQAENPVKRVRDMAKAVMKAWNSKNEYS